MSKLYSWMENNRRATQILVPLVSILLIAVLSVPVFLFIPGFWGSLEELHRQSAARFYGFVVAPAVVAAVSAFVWSWGSSWEKMKKSLYPDEQQ